MENPPLSEADFFAACNVILAHDERLDRVDRFLRDDDRDNGDGIFTYLPDLSGKLRRQTIKLIEIAAGLLPGDSVVTYFFDECRTMKGGGRINYPNGASFKVETLDDVWAVILHERALARA